MPALITFAILAFRRMGPVYPPLYTLSYGEKLALAVCLGISATLVLHLWFARRHDRVLKRIFWSLVLFVPVLGWVFYGGCYTALSPRGDSPGPMFDGTDPSRNGKRDIASP